MDEIFLILLTAALILTPPILGVIAFFGVRSLRREVAALKADLALLRAGGVMPVVAPAVEPEVAVDEAEPAPAPAMETIPAAEPAAPAPAEPALAEPPPPLEPAPALAAAAPKASLEERLTVRWAVWAGGATIALGGAFLVQYSIEQGLIGPGLRVLLGLLVGLALVVGAEWVRRGMARADAAEAAASYVPAALSAAGVSTLFASIYAAYALYDLIPNLLAFAGLAFVAAVALGLSLLHGPLVAALGLIGAQVVPMLVASDAPSALSLFGYLAIVHAGSVAVVRYKGWGWLASITLAGSAAWTFLWLVVEGSGDAAVIAAFLVLAAVATFGALAVPRLEWGLYGSAPRRWLDLDGGGHIAWGGLVLYFLLMGFLVLVEGHRTASLSGWVVLVVLVLAAARFDSAFDRLPSVSLTLTALLLSAWGLPPLEPGAPPLGVVEGQALAAMPGPIVPAGLERYLLAVAGFVALYVAGGLGGMASGAPRPARWAALAAIGPSFLLAFAYWRVADFDVSLPWMVVGLAIAGANAVAVERLIRRRDAGAPVDPAVLAVFALGVIAGIVFALTSAVRLAWLTVALSLMLPAIAWVNDRLRVPGLRQAAGWLALAVIVRLVLNQSVLDYPMGTTPVINWLLYGYGVPMVAFALAARWFRREAEDRLTRQLDAGAVLFAFALVTLELLHLAAGGRLEDVEPDFAHFAFLTAGWAALALALLRIHAQEPRGVWLWGWRILATMSATLLVVFLGVLVNPLWDSVEVGPLPVLNLLLVGYLLPAILFAAIAVLAERQGGHRLTPLAGGILALGAIFVWVTLEVRHTFQGTRLDFGDPSQAELYAYSAAWLAYGGALLALGLIRRSAALRYASLAVIVAAVLKVFLVDMSALEGLLRAVSFIGLGLVLVAIGYLYQRLVFPMTRRPAPGQTPLPSAEGPEHERR